MCNFRIKTTFIAFWIYIWLKPGQDVHFKFGQFTFSWPLCGLNMKYKKNPSQTKIAAFLLEFFFLKIVTFGWETGFALCWLSVSEKCDNKKIGKDHHQHTLAKKSPYPVSDSRVWKCTVLGSVMVSVMGSVIGSVLVSDMRSVKGFVMRSETVKPILIWVKLIWEAKFCEERLRQLTPAPSTGLVCYNYFGE